MLVSNPFDLEFTPRDGEREREREKLCGCLLSNGNVDNSNCASKSG
jgi:hypothetical protein